MKNSFERNFLKQTYEKPDAYDLARPSASYEDEVLGKLDLPQNAAILDLASGSGNEADFFRKRIGGNVVESDFSRSGFDRQDIHGNVVLSDAEQQPFRGGSFDLVHCKDLFVHLPNKELILREVSRILKPKGKFVLTTQMAQEDDNFFYFRLVQPDRTVLTSEKIYFENPEDYPELVQEVKVHYGPVGKVNESLPFYYLTEKSLEALLADTGFEFLNKSYWQPKKNEENWTKDPRIVYALKKSNTTK